MFTSVFNKTPQLCIPGPILQMRTLPRLAAALDVGDGLKDVRQCLGEQGACSLARERSR
ncbi:hypothetical protein KC19_9G064100 [Ceratodon purpureus]|uniref:Uncharacterized protein n=1 Tax=Ceratodon purpureus TaxID=3225 RepID=A0A8T0GS62_CERPU|nr:hypothetical protein KC19_9G064100 [Ceratodon purpureus]